MKIYVAGHRGMVGSAIVRKLLADGVSSSNLITKTHQELDLTNQTSVIEFFKQEKPVQVYLAAAKVGGIHANNEFPADFIYENLMIEANVINAAFKSGVKKLLFLGSSCIYPKFANQPIKESELLTGKLEPTNEPYAVAKIAGIKLCESYNRQFGKKNGIDYRSVMPTNLYGPGDDYFSDNSHVIPALIRRFHEAKVNMSPEVTVWGTGNPRREFLHVDDMAKACVHVMNLDKNTYNKNTVPMQSHINIGCGEDVTIKELAELVSSVVGFQGNITFDSTKNDGAPRKLLDISLLIKSGWSPSVPLYEGLAKEYENYVRELENVKK